MILQLEQYIKHNPRVSLAELGLYFQTPLDVMTEMIGLLQRKNRLEFKGQDGLKRCLDCSICQGCVTDKE